jgi:hypothetical protein
VGTTCPVSPKGSMGSRVAENFKLTLQVIIIGCNAARMEAIRNDSKIFAGNLKTRGQLENMGVE